MTGASLFAGLGRKLFYVNRIMQEKLRFGHVQVVEVYVEVVEALQIQSMEKYGMQDAGMGQRI